MIPHPIGIHFNSIYQRAVYLHCTYVQVSSVARTAHEDPVRLTGLRDRGQEVGSVVMGS